ncbi:hypothetical protein EWM64_g600 [Hericium alpestre]|uniref:Uncharacterized protein n=1 Tax=Hericium alpestre TaxID=135208 RepID=A0A4Z0AAR7_9AGAM|nr:hypothetical protein EWM64_g600 [Hericium alpestre]
MSDLGDLILSADVYECFDGNTVEVEIMLDYLTVQRISPRHIYRDIVEHIQSQPRKFAPLIERDLFVDVYNVVPGPDPGIDTPRQRICRVCAAEVFLYGLKDWWIRERNKGFLEPSVTERPNCPNGNDCLRQKEHAHAKEFNHIIPVTPLPADSGPSTSTQPVFPSQSAGLVSQASEAAVRAALMDGDGFVPLHVPSSSPPLGDPDIVIGSSQEFRDAVDAML